MNVSTLRARIAAGEVKTGGGGGPKVGEGLFNCLITEAVYGKGNNGNDRAMFTAKVISGGTDQEVGGTFHLYSQTVKEQFLEQDIALWAKILVEGMGLAEEKIYNDAETYQDILINIVTIAAKLARNNKLKLIIERKEQTKLDANGRKQFWNNIKGVADVEGTLPGEVAPGVPAMPAPAASAAQIAAVANVGHPSKPW